MLRYFCCQADGRIDIHPNWNMATFNDRERNPPELDGFIVFCHHLNSKIDNIEGGGGIKQRLLRDDGNKSQNNSNFQYVHSWYGFCFVVENAVDDKASWTQNKEDKMKINFSPERPIPLICPFNVINEVAYAATLECKVRIHRYKIIVQDMNDEDVIKNKSQKQKYRSDLRIVAHDDGDSFTSYFMELAPNGIAVLDGCESSQEQQQQQQYCNNHTSPSKTISSMGSTLSLGDFQKLEDSEQDVIKYNQNHEFSFFLKKPSLSQRKFSIWAAVDAISPIIPWKKSEPFALMELYQENHCQERQGGLKETVTRKHAHTPGTCIDEFTSVAVLKGLALLRHQTLEPGQKIVMHHVHVSLKNIFLEWFLFKAKKKCCLLLAFFPF